MVTQNADGTPAIWEMNGTSIIGGGLLPNPGPEWQIKDDGAIPAESAGAVAHPPALGAPDTANPVPMRSVPDGSAGPPTPGLAGPLVPTWSSLTGHGGTDPTWARQLHAGSA